MKRDLLKASATLAVIAACAAVSLCVAKKVNAQTAKTDAISYTVSTSTAPTASTEGASLKDAVGYSVIMSAASGQYFDGTGTMLCYYYGAVDASGTFRWMPCKSTLNVSMSGTNAIRDVPSGEFSTLVGYGRVKYVPSGVDAGVTAIRVTIVVRRR